VLSAVFKTAHHRRFDRNPAIPKGFLKKRSLKMILKRRRWIGATLKGQLNMTDGFDKRIALLYIARRRRTFQKQGPNRGLMKINALV